MNEIGKFIKENEDLINNNQWSVFYDSIYKIHKPGNLTIMFIKAGINPLDYLNYMPQYYLSYTDIKWFMIPNHIKFIGAQAFSECRNLESIYIPKSVNTIKNGVFFNDFNLKHIYYEGTEEDWKHIIKPLTWDANTGNYQIHYNQKF